MTKLLIINPNATAAMTDSVVASARQVAPRAQITGWTSKDGPPSIQGPKDGALAVPPLLRLIEEAVNTGFDAIIIACFDDTGLAEAKAMSPVPVIGIGEASYHAARLLGHLFSVVTTLSVSVPVLEANITATGFGDICGGVRASEVPVLEIERDPQAAFKAIRAEAIRALAEDEVSAIVLGCAGMTGLADSLSDLEAEIIDGVVAATKLALAMVDVKGAG